MGGSGGGGNSGKIEYPVYMQTAHSDWLDNTGADSMTSSIVDLMKIAHGSSPFSGLTVYDPDTRATVFEDAVDDFSTFVLAMEPGTDWTTAISTVTSYIDASVLDDTTLDAEVAAHDAIIDARLTDTILPRFQIGMRDINAVVSSSFVIGQSNLEAQAQLDKNKFSADLRLSNYKQRNDMIMNSTKEALNLFIHKAEYFKIANHYLIEAARIKMVMKNEELGQQIEIDEKDTVWDMSVYQYGGNVLASIAGAAAATRGNQPSTAQKALGGALSGAAAGAAIGAAGGPIGAGGGALLGLGASLL